MSRIEQFEKILKKLRSTSDGVQGAALISEDGLLLASVLEPDLHEARVAAASAALIELAQRAAGQLARGAADEVIVRASEGLVIVLRVTQQVLILAFFRPEARLGVVLLDLHDAKAELKRLL